MPNWCGNVVEIKGDAEDLKKIEDVNLSFAKLVPFPEELDEDEDVPCEWACDNWGTKWDIVGGFDDPCFEAFDGGIKVTFDTAWSPPIEFFEKLTAKMPSLEVDLKYWEGGCQLLGHCVFKEGKAAELPIKDEKGFIKEHFGWWNEEESDEEEEEAEAEADEKGCEADDEKEDGLFKLLDQVFKKAQVDKEKVFAEMEQGIRESLDEGGCESVWFSNAVKAKMMVDNLRSGYKRFERLERGRELMAAQA